MNLLNFRFTVSPNMNSLTKYKSYGGYFWCDMTSLNLVSNGSDDDMLLDGIKPLFELMLIYQRWGRWLSCKANNTASVKRIIGICNMNNLEIHVKKHPHSPWQWVKLPFSPLPQKWAFVRTDEELYIILVGRLTLNSTVMETYTTAFPGLLGPGSCNLLTI